MRVNHSVTVTRHTVRRNMSVLILKNLSSALRLNTPRRVTPSRLRSLSAVIRNIRQEAHCAESVPVAIPSTPILNTPTSVRLTAMLNTTMKSDTHMVTLVFCRPRNQPLKQ